ncbi:MAG TPA: tetratricopeptide repeat protein [Labilithrix sp.]
MEAGSETHRLRREIERALRRAFDPADVLPRLARLARLAPPSSDDGVFANRQLAELLVERHPWRAAIHARRALDHRPNDDRAWAVLAFCQTLLGNFRCAATAYKRAIASAPGNPWYAHNLGHLLDVALGVPERALPWLERAYGAKGDNSEIVASYAHALARAKRTDRAREVLERALGRFESRELEALLRWLDQGAPKTRKLRKEKKREPRTGRLARVLERGMMHLPLDDKQRERALALARDAVTDAVRAAAAAHSRARPRDRSEDVAGLAAAVAYAIVYVDHVPLSQAEVAAPFRVGVGRLRGRFAELRARLDLIPGDERYASARVQRE